MHGLPFIRLNRRKVKRAAIIAAGLLTVLVLAVVFLCAWLGIYSRMDVLGYRAMMQEHYPPIWKDLAWRRIRKGDSLDSLLQKHPPVWREDFGPYVHLSYIMPPDFNWLGITAKDGRLINARAGSCTWHHIFFDAPDEEDALKFAYSAYQRQRILEWDAFRIHRAITGGQDVFFARLIERRKVPDNSDRSRYAQDMMEDLRKLYGQEYLDSMMTRPQLTVEVTKVVSGDLLAGAVLTFLGDNCRNAETGRPEPLFLHFDDERLIYPRYPAHEIYLTAPMKALEWYQSLTPDQVKDLQARCLAEWAKRGIDVRVSEGTVGEAP